MNCGPPTSSPPRENPSNSSASTAITRWPAVCTICGWSRRCWRRGVVAVDDIGNLSCPGVIEATIRYGLGADAVLAPFAVVVNKLFMARREHCAWYHDTLLSAARAGDLGETGTALASYDAHMRALGIPVQLLGEDILTGA